MKNLYHLCLLPKKFISSAFILEHSYIIYIYVDIIFHNSISSGELATSFENVVKTSKKPIFLPIYGGLRL